MIEIYWQNVIEPCLCVEQSIPQPPLMQGDFNEDFSEDFDIGEE